MGIKEKIKKGIYKIFLSQDWFIRYKYNDQLKSAETFVKNHNVEINDNINNIAKEMVDGKIRFNISFDEFFQFHFENKDDIYKFQFVSDYDRRKRYTDGLNKRSDVFAKKYLTYQYYKKFYKRDMCLVNDTSDCDDCSMFFETNKSFIAKPVKSLKGIGVKNGVFQIFTITERVMLNSYPN